MNTSDGSPDCHASTELESQDVDTLLADESKHGTSDAQAKKQVNAENRRLDKKDRKHELTVVAALLIVSIIDGIMFSYIDNWSAPLVIGALQLLAALIFAKNYGVEEIQIWANKIIEKFPSNGSGNKASNKES